MWTLVESDEFARLQALLGEPAVADAKLNGILYRIAKNPESFPIDENTNERITKEKIEAQIVDVIFRIIPNTKQVELLRLLVKTA